MGKKAILLFITIIFYACQQESKKHESFKFFVFSVSAENRNYSIKFTESDTVFVEERFPRPKRCFFFLIKNTDKDSIQKLVNEIQFSKYDSVYDENKVNGLVDGTEYKFYVQKDSSKNYVYIYGRIGPKEFYGFAKRIELLKQKQKLILINKQVDFGNLYHILLPDPPAFK